MTTTPESLPGTTPGPKLTYTAVSFALLVPVLVWPVFWWHNDATLDIADIWQIAAASLLLSAIAVDSVLGFRQSAMAPFLAAGWILFGSLAVSMALRSSDGAYLIACLFALHALRSASRLWQHDISWWLWPAWGRDSLAALGMFVWLFILDHA